MIREEFISVVTNTGMATLKELRRLTLNKKLDEVTEFEVLSFPHFDEQKFAKIVSEKHSLTFKSYIRIIITSITVKTCYCFIQWKIKMYKNKKGRRQIFVRFSVQFCIPV